MSQLQEPSFCLKTLHYKPKAGNHMRRIGESLTNLDEDRLRLGNVLPAPHP